MVYGLLFYIVMYIEQLVLLYAKNSQIKCAFLEDVNVPRTAFGTAEKTLGVYFKPKKSTFHTFYTV